MHKIFGYGRRSASFSLSFRIIRFSTLDRSSFQQLQKISPLTDKSLRGQFNEGFKRVEEIQMKCYEYNE